MAKKAFVYDGTQWVDIAQSTTDLSAYAPVANPTLTGTVTAPKIALTDTTDASLSSTGNAIQIGSTSGVNLVFDNNEIQVRNNGVASSLFINNDGGSVGINTTAGSSGTTTIGNATGSNSLIVNGSITANSANFVSGGAISITPVSGVATSGNISWGTTMPSIPFIATSSASSASVIINTQFTSAATTGCTVWIVRNSTASTSVNAVAVCI
jgi:hypothetical protein